jgi:hypothetical protein
VDARDQKRDKLITGLQSDNEILILNAIRQLYTDGTVELLPNLFKLYFLTKSEIIRKEILELLNNLKDKNACPYLVDAVIKYRGQEYYHQIVSSCWQSGLDYSQYLKVFIDLVIEQDLFTAVEAFSVVEGNIPELNPPVREKHAIYIRSKLGIVSEDRKNLVKELLLVIENISGPFSISLN